MGWLQIDITREKTKIQMLSRSGLDYTSRYPRLAQALKELKIESVLDGEAVILNEEGKPDFDALQLYNGDHAPIVYYVFDVLWLAGYNLMQLPLTSRKKMLADLLKGNRMIR